MFDIHQSIFNKHGEHDEDRVAKYIDGLMNEFAASPEAQPIVEERGRVGWAANMMEYAFGYVGVEVPKMSLRDFNEVVFELIPRKVSTQPESAAAIIAELRAFWSFVDRQYALPNAQKIRDTLTDEATRRLHAALADPSHWGMAKSMVMHGIKAGFDMTTQEGMDACMLAYNSQLLANRAAGLPPVPALARQVFSLLSSPDSFAPDRGSHEDREKKRKARKAQRQARKRNRG